MTFVLASCIVFSFLLFDVEDLRLQRLDGTKWGAPIPRGLSLQRSLAAPLCLNLDGVLITSDSLVPRMYFPFSVGFYAGELF